MSTVTNDINTQRLERARRRAAAQAERAAARAKVERAESRLRYAAASGAWMGYHFLQCVGGTQDTPDSRLRLRIQQVARNYQELNAHKRGMLARLLASVEDAGFGRREKAIQYLGPLVRIAERHRHWVRDPETWQCPDGPTRQRLSHLLRHLFALYPVPTFLDAAWFHDRTGHQNWFIHIGRGGSVRTMKGLPLPMTRRMAHWFVHAPDDIPPERAPRWSQVRALGGTDAAALAVCGTMLGHSYRDNEVWTSVIRFFIAHPELALEQYGPVIDYLHATLPDDPCNARFTMRGRTVVALLRQVRAWHREIYEESCDIDEPFQWDRSRFPSGEITGPDGAVYQVCELTSTDELREEGRAMQHCVLTYAHACRRRGTAIFSLRMGDLPLVTRQALIVQARACANAAPAEPHRRVLAAWAGQAGLRIDPSAAF